jgi:hypothetical protein
MLAEAVLFLAWKPDRLALFVEPVFRLTIIEKEKENSNCTIAWITINCDGNSLYLSISNNYVVRLLSANNQFFYERV